MPWGGFLSLFLILYFKALFPGFLRSRELEVYLKIMIYFPLSLFLMPWSCYLISTLSSSFANFILGFCNLTFFIPVSDKHSLLPRFIGKNEQRLQREICEWEKMMNLCKSFWQSPTIYGSFRYLFFQKLSFKQSYTVNTPPTLYYQVTYLT